MKNSLFKPFLFKKRIYQAIKSKERFHNILDRERERSDRNGGFFSLLSFRIQKSLNEGDIIALIGALKKRIRHIDELGWLDHDVVGILLPDTPYEGAVKLSRVINAQDVKEDAYIRFQVTTYPEQKLPRYKNKEQEEAARDAQPGTDVRILTGKPIPAWKRALDIVGAAVALVLLFPLMTLIALFIKSVSPGPVFFKQERIGFNGIPFVCWKFRTMRADTDPEQHKKHVSQLIENGAQWNKLDDRPDAGIIPFGNILRKAALDELPQLFNVLKGEMSLIGPRPCVAYEASQFRPWQNKRFDTHPGLTGLWQVSGKNTTTFDEMIRLDISYGKRRSLARDVLIFFKTFPVVVKQTLNKL